MDSSNFLKQADIVAANPLAERFCIVKARKAFLLNCSASHNIFSCWSIQAFIYAKDKQRLFMRWNEWAENRKSFNSVWIFLTREIVSYVSIFVRFSPPTQTSRWAVLWIVRAESLNTVSDKAVSRDFKSSLSYIQNELRLFTSSVQSWSTKTRSENVERM